MQRTCLLKLVLLRHRHLLSLRLSCLLGTKLVRICVRPRNYGPQLSIFIHRFIILLLAIIVNILLWHDLSWAYRLIRHNFLLLIPLVTAVILGAVILTCRGHLFALKPLQLIYAICVFNGLRVLSLLRMGTAFGLLHWGFKQDLA